MADTTSKAVKKEETLVPLLIPLSNNPKDPTEEFISVNFKNYLVKKGTTVMVPPEVKAVYDASIRAQAEAAMYERELVERSNQ